MESIQVGEPEAAVISGLSRKEMVYIGVWAICSTTHNLTSEALDEENAILQERLANVDKQLEML